MASPLERASRNRIGIRGRQRPLLAFSSKAEGFHTVPSPQRGRREGSRIVPSPQAGERVRVRGRIRRQQRVKRPERGPGDRKRSGGVVRDQAEGGGWKISRTEEDGFEVE